jgi:hypothetical protein
VRRMFDRVGHSVIRLKRIRTGTLTLGGLPEGTFRYLTTDEVSGLREMAHKSETSIPEPAVRSRKAAVRPIEGPGSRVQGQGVRLMNARGTKKPAHRGAQPDARPWRAEFAKKEGPGSGVKGRGGMSGYGRTAIGARSQKPGVSRVRTPAMQDTREGLRRNQVVKAAASQQKRSFDGPRTAARSNPRVESTYIPTSRPSASRPTMRTGIGRPAPGADMGKTEVRRKPDQRPWPSTRKSGPGSRGPGAATGYGPRRDSSTRPATRSSSNRPTTRPGFGRPAAEAVSGKSETRRKPASRSWPDSGSGRSDSRIKGTGYEGRGQRPSSGPRPNRSTHTGKGPTRGNRPAGPRGPGQGAGKRGPRR